jgi:hypothetical protein
LLDNDKKLFKTQKMMTMLGERGQMTSLLITQDASNSDVPCKSGTTGFIYSIQYGYKRKLKRLPERQKFEICYYRNQFHTKNQQSTLYTMKENTSCIVLPEEKSQAYNPVFWPHLTQP